MAEIGRVVTVTTGFGGAPGYTSHYFFGDPYSTSTAQDNSDDVRAFWETFAASMPSSWHYSIQPNVDVLDEVTGALIRTESTTPLAQSVTGGSTEYAAGVGAVCTWNTAAVHGSKHLRGRTFIIPIGSTNFEGDGTIKSGPLGQFRNAATTLAAVANFGVWGRPVAGAGGDWAACTGGTVRDHVAWLSSRRD